MKTGELKEVTGEWVKSCYNWLQKEKQGCCSLWYASTDKWCYCVCIGWHHYDDDMVKTKWGVKYCPIWKVAWKIGRQSHDNAMQCDFDVDFEMPFPCNEYGDVWDSLDVIEPNVFEANMKKFWNEVAVEIRKEARKVWQFFKDKDDWTEEDFAFQLKHGSELKVLVYKGTIHDRRLRKLGRGRYEWNGSEGKYTIMHLGRSWEISINQHIYTTAPQSLKEAVKILDEKERYK
jgi:hypothetical protein